MANRDLKKEIPLFCSLAKHTHTHMYIYRVGRPYKNLNLKKNVTFLNKPNICAFILKKKYMDSV